MSMLNGFIGYLILIFENKKMKMSYMSSFKW